MKRNWISVKERLPDNNIRVIGINDIDMVYDIYYSLKNGFEDFHYGDNFNSTITHWYPLDSILNQFAEVEND